MRRAFTDAARRSARGISMIEAIVAVALLGVGVAAAMGALGRLMSADTAVREREQLLRLSTAKLQELRATGDYALAPLDGDFSDVGQARITWTAELEPTGIENLDLLTVTSTRQGGGARGTVTVTSLVFRTPVGGTAVAP